MAGRDGAGQPARDDVHGVVCTVGRGTYTALEWPGIVRDASKALQALGGEASVPAAGDGELVRLALRPGDPYAHALYGDCKPHKALLVRVSQQRAGPTQQLQPHPMAAAGGVRLEVVGRVQALLQFTGMADYQYLPVDTTYTARDCSRAPAENLPEKAEPSGAVQPLLCVPPLFSKHDAPFDYAYKQFSFQDPKTKALKTVVISFYSAAIPPPTAAMQAASAAPGPAAGPSGDTTAAAAAGEAMDAGQEAPATPAGLSAAACEAQLLQLLSQRPIWSFPWLAQRLGPTQHLQAGLAKHTYRFKTGPWRGLYIRRGYDPRQVPASQQYQAVTYTLPDSWWEAAGLAPVHLPTAQVAVPVEPQGPQLPAVAGGPPPPAPCPNMEDICRFQALPTQRSTVLQLCDLQDPHITALWASPPQPRDAAAAGHDGTAVAAAAAAAPAAASPAPPLRPLAVCHDEYGWLSQAQWHAVVQAVQQRFQALMAQQAAAAAQQARQPAAEVGGRPTAAATGGAPPAAGDMEVDVQAPADDTAGHPEGAERQGGGTARRRGGRGARGRSAGRGKARSSKQATQQQQQQADAGATAAEAEAAEAATAAATPAAAVRPAAGDAAAGGAGMEDTPAGHEADVALAAEQASPQPSGQQAQPPLTAAAVMAHPQLQVHAAPAAQLPVGEAVASGVLQQLMQQMQLQPGGVPALPGQAAAGGQGDDEDAYELLDQPAAQQPATAGNGSSVMQGAFSSTLGASLSAGLPSLEDLLAHTNGQQAGHVATGHGGASDGAHANGFVPSHMPGAGDEEEALSLMEEEALEEEEEEDGAEEQEEDDEDELRYL